MAAAGRGPAVLEVKAGSAVVEVSDDAWRALADELAVHLALVLGGPVPVQRPGESAAGATAPCVFRVGLGADTRSPSSPPSGYLVSDHDVCFFDRESSAAAVAAAVYAFLDRECAVRWLAPGPQSSVCLRPGPLRLTRGVRSVAPPPALPVLALQAWDWAGFLKEQQAGIPEAFRVTPETAAARRAEDWQWRRRQRLGDGPATEVAPATRLRLAELGLPLGREQELFEALRRAQRRGETPLFEVPWVPWDVSGLTYYAVAWAVNDPKASFAEVEADYAAAFGAAAPDVRQYFAFWRQHYQEVLVPRRQALEAAGCGDWLRGLYAGLAEAYQLAQFRASAVFLHQGLQHDLGAAEKQRFERLVLAHEHAEAIFAAIEGWATSGDDPKKLKQAIGRSGRLPEFRRTFAAELNLCLPRLLLQERTMDDATGVERAVTFKDVEPSERLPLQWRFRADPEDKGVAGKWFALEWSEIEQQWPQLRVDCPWEIQSAASPEAPDLSRYDGAAWYAATVELPPELRSRQVFAHVWAGDDDLTLYVNGQVMGESHHPPGPRWPAALRFRIDPALGGEKPTQRLVIRVQDSGGLGGLRQPVWLSLGPRGDAAKEPPPEKAP
jgi:hypothetical protein